MMILLIGLAIFLIVMIIKSISIYKNDNWESNKTENYLVKEKYNDKDIPLSVALKEFKIVEFKTHK